MTAALALATLLFVLPARAADPAAELGARLSEQGTLFLSQLLGPGRGRVLVTVDAERRETHSQRELSAPVENKDEDKAMPGYTDAAALAAARKPSTVVTSRDDSLSSNDLVIKKLRVMAVLDTRLAEAQVVAVRRLLPEFLMMDGDRGDDISVVRAPLRPAWRDALESPEGARALMVTGAVVFSAFLIVLAGYLAASRAVSALTAELAARRASGGNNAAPASPFGPLPPGPEPELLPGGLPGLGAEGETIAAPAALGRRFDFLAGKAPAEITDLLQAENVEELAHLFAYLASANPDLAGNVFSSLPAARQGQLSQAVLGVTMADPDRLAALEGRLRTQAEFGMKGPQRLARILSRLPPEQREGLIGEVVSANPGAAAEIERSLFPFENVASLKPADLRRLLASVPYAEWGTALRGASKELTDAVLKELPEGARQQVAEAAGTPAPRARVVEARSRILSQLQSLSERGQVDLGRAEMI